MNAQYPSAEPAHSDRYPSRGALKAQLLPRVDPVVYSTRSEDAPLLPEQIEQYERDGFLILEDIFDRAEMIAYQEEMEELLKQRVADETGEVITEQGSRDVRSIFRIHETSGVFREMAADSRITGVVRYLLNDEVYIHQSRLNYKPGFRGKEFYWHSDFETWHVEDGMPAMRALSVSITLTANDDNNGPLMLIPESHKNFAVCEGVTPENHFQISLKKQQYGVPDDQCLSELVERGGIVAARCEPGSVIIFDCNTMHGSNSNITPHPRSNAFFVYNAMSNRLQSPFCGRAPRPEYISARENIAPLAVTAPNTGTELNPVAK